MSGERGQTGNGTGNEPGDKTMRGGVLFVCNMNSVRSPMAEALGRVLLPAVAVESAGVHEGAPDPFVEIVLAEEGIPRPPHAPRTFADIEPNDFAHVVALTGAAYEEALHHFPPGQVEQWQVPNPTDEYGSRDRMIAAYRELRDMLKMRIIARFDPSFDPAAGSGT